MTTTTDTLAALDWRPGCELGGCDRPASLALYLPCGHVAIRCHRHSAVAAVIALCHTCIRPGRPTGWRPL